MKIRVLASMFAVLALVSQANAAIVMQQVENAAPNANLQSFTVHAVAGAGELVNSIAGVSISGGIHNVTPAFGQPSVTRAQWDAPNGAGDQAWKVYDTYLLFSPSNASEVVGFIGSATETNDNSNPAGLSLSASGQSATIGLGSYKFSSATDQITLTPAAAAQDLAFLQVVLPKGTSQVLTATFFNTQGQSSGALQFTVGATIPEPASLALGSFGLLGLAAIRRRFV